MARRAGETRQAIGWLKGAVLAVAIAVILGILLVALMPCARGPSPTLQVRHEMAQLELAVENFKSVHGIPYLPAAFNLRDQYPDPTDLHAAYLRRLWPALAESTPGSSRSWGRGPGPVILNGNQCLVFFLGGPDGDGFAAAPRHPAARGGPRVGPFFDFAPHRLSTAHEFLDPWGTPYAYFTAVNGDDYEYTDPTAPGAVRPGQRLSGRGPAGPGGPRPCWRGPKQAANGQSFQILSAGPDQAFGVGGMWQPGQGDYAPGMPGYDDLANFHPRRLGAP